jgi:hypothetical protein
LLTPGVCCRYGGILENGPKEFTLDDFYTLQLDKLDRFNCLKECPITSNEWNGSDSEDDDDSDDEDEEDDDKKSRSGSDASDDDEDGLAGDAPMKDVELADLNLLTDAELAAREAAKANAEKEELRKRATAFMGVSTSTDRSAEDILSTPQPGESLAQFFARSREFWTQRAHANATGNRGKELRRDGFTLAEEAFSELKASRRSACVRWLTCLCFARSQRSTSPCSRRLQGSRPRLAWKRRSSPAARVLVWAQTLATAARARALFRCNQAYYISHSSSLRGSQASGLVGQELWDSLGLRHNGLDGCLDLGELGELDEGDLLAEAVLGQVVGVVRDNLDEQEVGGARGREVRHCEAGSECQPRSATRGYCSASGQLTSVSAEEEGRAVGQLAVRAGGEGLVVPERVVGVAELDAPQPVLAVLDVVGDDVDPGGGLDPDELLHDGADNGNHPGRDDHYRDLGRLGLAPVASGAGWGSERHHDQAEQSHKSGTYHSKVSLKPGSSWMRSVSQSRMYSNGCLAAIWPRAEGQRHRWIGRLERCTTERRRAYRVNHFPEPIAESDLEVEDVLVDLEPALLAEADVVCQSGGEWAGVSHHAPDRGGTCRPRGD